VNKPAAGTSAMPGAGRRRGLDDDGNHLSACVQTAFSGCRSVRPCRSPRVLWPDPK